MENAPRNAKLKTQNSFCTMVSYADLSNLEGAAPPPPSPGSRRDEAEEEDSDEPMLQSCGQIGASTLAKLQSELGHGPMRFAPAQPERSIDEQIQALHASERACFDTIKSKWQARRHEARHSSSKTNNNDSSSQHTYFTDEMYLRFCRCSPGGKPFKDKTAWKTMKKFSKRYLQLTTDSLETALRSETVFPLPSLRTMDGLEVVYMRPSRHCVKTTDTRIVLDMLAYTLSTMMEREEPCRRGVVLLAYMDGFAMCNYATDYWYQFMSMLQGFRVPVRIAQFLIVNPPTWFKNIWNLTESMLTPDFVQRSVMIANESDLSSCLVAGYEAHLPDEMQTGRAVTAKLVNDFVAYRKAVETVQGHQLAFQKRASITSSHNNLQESSSSIFSLESLSETDKSERSCSKSGGIAEAHRHHHHRNIPRNAPEESQSERSAIWNMAFFTRSSRRLLMSEDKDKEEDDTLRDGQSSSFSSSLEEPHDEKSGLWNTPFFSRSSRRLELSDKNNKEKEEEYSNSSTNINKQQRLGGDSMPKQGMQRTASRRSILSISKKVKSDDCGTRPRVPVSHLGTMMQRRPSSDNLASSEEFLSRRGMTRRQSAHGGLFCEKTPKDDQTKGKTSNSSPPPRLGAVSRQMTQESLRSEKTETSSRKRGGRRGDLVKQRLPSERVVAEPTISKTPTRRQISRAKSFKSFLPSSFCSKS